MSVLVTGGTGFIGAAVVRMLLERGEEEVVASHIHPEKKTLEDLSSRVKTLRADLGIFSHVIEVVKTSRPRTIYHLGAMLTLPSQTDPAASFRTNVMGTYHVLEAARLFDVEQVLFASSIGSYGTNLDVAVVDDFTVQRPTTMYGVSKLFGEHLGLFYKNKYGMDFRGVRYPGIVGPGFRTPSPARFASLILEEAAKGNPLTLTVNPQLKISLLYFKDAARAIMDLAQAPLAHIKTVNYNLNGFPPEPTAMEIMEMAKARIPGARLQFAPDAEVSKVLRRFPPLDDRMAREEWGWRPQYTMEKMIDDFLEELKRNPSRYA